MNSKLKRNIGIALIGFAVIISVLGIPVWKLQIYTPQELEAMGYSFTGIYGQTGLLLMGIVLPVMFGIWLISDSRKQNTVKEVEKE